MLKTKFRQSIIDLLWYSGAFHLSKLLSSLSSISMMDRQFSSSEESLNWVRKMCLHFSGFKSINFLFSVSCCSNSQSQDEFAMGMIFREIKSKPIYYYCAKRFFHSFKLILQFTYTNEFRFRRWECINFIIIFTSNGNLKLQILLFLILFH